MLELPIGELPGMRRRAAIALCPIAARGILLAWTNMDGLLSLSCPYLLTFFCVAAMQEAPAMPSDANKRCICTFPFNVDRACTPC